jgi:hypothetical protein
MKIILGEYKEELSGIDICEVRGELLLPFKNLDKAREFNPSIKTAFTGVSSMSRDSATDEEISLLEFVAYLFLADDWEFDTKEEMYDFLEMDCGFKVPKAWVEEDIEEGSVIEVMKSVLADLEEDIKEYEYFTDGVVCEVNERDLFKRMGDLDNSCHVGNVALKVGFWEQNMYSGIVQTIMWTQGKKKLSPVAIISSEDNMIEFEGGFDRPYVTSEKEIENYNELGVLTNNGNTVRRVPLYEPNNIWVLEATVGNPLFFRFGGEAGVVPCFPNGKPLIEGRVDKMLEEEFSEEDEQYLYI